LLKIRARDPEHLSQILRERIGSVEGVRSTRTMIVSRRSRRARVCRSVSFQALRR
jgi:DNA-binding Lrp family transcriptional regulator